VFLRRTVFQQVFYGVLFQFASGFVRVSFRKTPLYKGKPEENPNKPRRNFIESKQKYVYNFYKIGQIRLVYCLAYTLKIGLRGNENEVENKTNEVIKPKLVFFNSFVGAALKFIELLIFRLNEVPYTNTGAL